MHLANRALYRGRQFFGSVRPHVDAAERAKAFELLTDGQRELFSSMTPRDQQHCLAVYRKLRDEGHDDQDLLVAALLHDAGKGEIALWHRVAFVMLDAAPPSLLDRLTRAGDSSHWREALYRCRNHAELGAALAKQAGSSEQVVHLIREEDHDDAQFAALRSADEAL
ncbi:MAG: HD domain-containing protein [Chloroflexi bacterium]|nr:HD domain-containing protein [Chloroflexota bacterium]